MTQLLCPFLDGGVGVVGDSDLSLLSHETKGISCLGFELLINSLDVHTTSRTRHILER